MDKPEFFNEDEDPTVLQAAAANVIKAGVDFVMTWGVGGGKTWLLNRVLRYIRCVDAHTEELVD
jgi:hypothetical protein